MEDRNEQARAAKALLGKGEKITVRWMGIPFRFTLKPLYLGAMIAMSEYISQIEGAHLDEANVLTVIGSAKETAPLMAKAAAHGILNRKLKRILFARALSRVIINSMTSSDLYMLLGVLTVKSDPQSFFGCTTLLAQMNVTKPKDRSKVVDSLEEKPSGEQSQE